MSHSDESIEDLLRQVDDYRQRRQLRDNRPERLTRFITETAGLFEPTQGVGRVGFECRPEGSGWLVAMYLGATEIVGGRHDGQTQRPGFRIDVATASQGFSTVDSVDFVVHPAGGTGRPKKIKAEIGRVISLVAAPGSHRPFSKVASVASGR